MPALVASVTYSAPIRLAGIIGLGVMLAAWPAAALDKQGSAHEGGSASGHALGVSGTLMLGTSIINPSYAARPDNSGKVRMRYAGHADVDLLGAALSIPLDVNVFSDDQRSGAGKFAPSELDLIGGVTTTWALGPGAGELGARVEHDAPVDRSGASQTYADVRARYLFALAPHIQGLGSALRGGDMSGWGTLGVFTVNPSYFARPDNTGRALFRYAAHAQISAWDGLLALALDATFFTDRQASNVVRPSELDFTPELIVRRRAFELHLAYEMDMPVDRGGLSQRFLYALLAWSFQAL